MIKYLILERNYIIIFQIKIYFHREIIFFQIDNIKIIKIKILTLLIKDNHNLIFELIHKTYLIKIWIKIIQNNIN